MFGHEINEREYFLQRVEKFIDVAEVDPVVIIEVEDTDGVVVLNRLDIVEEERHVREIHPAVPTDIFV